ncbi:hypothetical protein [Deinococcus planocerae]|uniref:hypothetical protein n=1 Tax=Deinococcus planocerae TaxID=1737569 RepID=UPI000C7EAD4F|nr:hypothetical protein [Deinococcus planocerae]
MIATTAPTLTRSAGRPPLALVVIAGVLRGLTGAVVFFNLFEKMPLGVIPFVFALFGGILGNFLFLAVVGLIYSLLTATGTRAYTLYARTFIIAIPLYLLILPALIVLMPLLPADASFSSVQGAQHVIAELRTSVAMQVYRYAQLTMFAAQVIYLTRLFRPFAPGGRVWIAASLCLALYGLLFFLGVI